MNLELVKIWSKMMGWFGVGVWLMSNLVRCNDGNIVIK